MTFIKCSFKSNHFYLNILQSFDVLCYYEFIKSYSNIYVVMFHIHVSRYLCMLTNLCIFDIVFKPKGSRMFLQDVFVVFACFFLMHFFKAKQDSEWFIETERYRLKLRYSKIRQNIWMQLLTKGYPCSRECCYKPLLMSNVVRQWTIALSYCCFSHGLNSWNRSISGELNTSSSIATCDDSKKTTTKQEKLI
jgi:hypothetical protein